MHENSVLTNNRYYHLKKFSKLLSEKEYIIIFTCITFRSYCLNNFYIFIMHLYIYIFVCKLPLHVLGLFLFWCVCFFSYLYMIEYFHLSFVSSEFLFIFNFFNNQVLISKDLLTNLYIFSFYPACGTRYFF